MSLVEQEEMQVMEELMNLDKLVKQDLVDLEAEAEELNKELLEVLGVQGKLSIDFYK
jgi:hypothetical protein